MSGSIVVVDPTALGAVQTPSESPALTSLQSKKNRQKERGETEAERREATHPGSPSRSVAELRIEPGSPEPQSGAMLEPGRDPNFIST